MISMSQCIKVEMRKELFTIKNTHCVRHKLYIMFSKCFVLVSLFLQLVKTKACGGDKNEGMAYFKKNHMAFSVFLLFSQFLMRGGSRDIFF